MTSSGLPGRLRKRTNSCFTTSLLSVTAATSFAIAFSGSLIASPTVGPLTSAITGPSCRLLDRSHSQALSRAGRPRLPRKPSAARRRRRAALRPALPVAAPANDEVAPGRAVDRVVQHFGRQPPGEGVRVVDLVVFVPLVGGDRELIRARLADQLHHVARVEVALDELAGQVVEQLGVGRRVAGADVVERLDDADAGQVAPEAVDVALGEVRVVGRRDPVGQLLAARLALLGRMLGFERERRAG